MTDNIRLTRKGVFMAWRMSEGEGYEIAGAQAADAYPDGNDPDGDPRGEFAEAFNTAHPARVE